MTRKRRAFIAAFCICGAAASLRAATPLDLKLSFEGKAVPGFARSSFE